MIIRFSSSVTPDVKYAVCAPALSSVTRYPLPAPVNARAPPTTSCSTVSRSRSSVMRRLVWRSRERRTRKASASRIGSSFRIMFSPGQGPVFPSSSNGWICGITGATMPFFVDGHNRSWILAVVITSKSHSHCIVCSDFTPIMRSS